MGFRLNVTGGAEQIALDEKSIKNVVLVPNQQLIPMQGRQISEFP